MTNRGPFGRENPAALTAPSGPFPSLGRVRHNRSASPRRTRKNGGGEILMAKVAPFHSKLSGTDRHHDNDRCTEGNNIESYNRVSGPGGHPRCKRCTELAGQ